VKILQFFFVLGAGILLPSIPNGFIFPRYAFFVFIVWTSFMYIVIDLFLHLTGLWESLPKALTSPVVLCSLLGLGCFMFLISSTLVAAASSTLTTSSDKVTSILAAICGLVSMILLGIELGIRLKDFIRRRKEASEEEDRVETDI